jgi:hypothetical protein
MSDLAERETIHNFNKIFTKHILFFGFVRLRAAKLLLPCVPPCFHMNISYYYDNVFPFYV